ncbi:MAG: FCD domain-containing protein [Actinobacteria bacterium]|nr:FCD domain-containing protein [Actinomycetota bacterium]MTB03343.1 FCD domain-containing protein [Actinomycetota bacterium]
MQQKIGYELTKKNVIQHVSLPQAVQSELRKRILNNEFISGERLLEVKLAEEYGVSRTTLRSALSELRVQGLIEISVRRGAYVTRMSKKAISEACFARYFLESSVLEDNVIKLSSELISEFETILGEMAIAAKKSDLASLVYLDTEFHSLIVNLGGRERIQQLWHTLDGQMGSLMRSSLDSQKIELVEVVGRHRILLGALKLGNPHVIRAAMKEHYIPNDERLPESAPRSNVRIEGKKK